MRGTDFRAVTMFPCVVDGRNWWRIVWFLHNGGEYQIRCMTRDDCIFFAEAQL